jgi:hypothetical protein
MSYEELPILYGRNKFQVCGDIQDRKDEGYSFRENERYFITLRKLLAQIGTKNVARIKHILMIGDSSIPCGSIENFVSQTMTVGAQYRSLELLLSLIIQILGTFRPWSSTAATSGNKIQRCMNSSII